MGLANIYHPVLLAVYPFGLWIIQSMAIVSQVTGTSIAELPKVFWMMLIMVRVYEECSHDLPATLLVKSRNT